MTFSKPFILKSVIAIVVIGLILFLGITIGKSSAPLAVNEDGTQADSGSFEPDCTISGINMHGQLMTYLPPEALADGEIAVDAVASENILYMIRQAEEDEQIKGILVEIDSVGGSPVAAEEVADALKRAQKPTVAVIRDIGASAAYWAATGADRIFASKNSDVGGIGVTMSYLDETEKNRKEGLSYVDLSTGKFKDTGSVGRPLTAEERTLIMRDLRIINENFMETISANRTIPIAQIRTIADGSTVLGTRALELKLIDEIGGVVEAEKYLSDKIGAEAITCW